MTAPFSRTNHTHNYSLLGVGSGLLLCPLLAHVINAEVNAFPLGISTVALLHVTLRVPGRIRIAQLCQDMSTELADQSESYQETTIALEERNRMLAAIEQIRTEITATIDLEEIIDTYLCRLSNTESSEA